MGRVGRRLTFLSLILTAILLATIPSQAAVVFFDNFSDGDRAGWWATTPSATLYVTNYGGSYGNVLEYNPDVFYRSYVTTFPLTSLAMGEQLILTFAFRFTGTAWTDLASSVQNDIRFGLYNANSTFASSDSTTQDTDDYGYYTRVRLGNSTPNRAYREVGPGGTTDHIQTLTVATQLGINTLATNLKDNNWHSAYLELTRVPTGIQMVVKVDGTQIFNVTNTSSFITQFNEIAIGEGALPLNNRGLQVDNVTVSYIPLPGTVLLLGSGLLGVGLLGWRRRRS